MSMRAGGPDGGKRPPRPWTLPRAPFTPRPEGAMLAECPDARGLLLWCLLRAAYLWMGTEPDRRAGLFGAGSRVLLQRLAPWVPELDSAVRMLAELCTAPDAAHEAHVAAASAQVVDWAVANEHREVAIQFAELAAWVEPQSSPRAAAAGRLLRDSGDPSRARLWFARAVRLARRARSNTDFAFAHLGWGTLEHHEGRLTVAREHYLKAARAAVRNGRTEIAAYARHDLLGLSLAEAAAEEALEHATHAVNLYPKRHARLPALAFDIAVFWVELGYYSSAVYLLQVLDGFFTDANARLLYVSTFAQAAAGACDRPKFGKLKSETLKALVPDEYGAVAAYRLACGARMLERWNDALDLAEKAEVWAHCYANPTLAARASELVAQIQAREPAADDTVPEEGSAADRITYRLLLKLRRLQRPKVPRTDLVFPDRYPIS